MPKQRLKKRADGRYRCKYGDKCFYGKTEKEAKDARSRFIAETLQGLNPDEHATTVDAYAQRWLPIYRSQSCEKSYRMYARMLDEFIAFTKNAKIKDVKKTTIVAFYNTLDNYSPSHMSKYVDTISGLFSAAKEDGIIWIDPTAGVTPPSGVANKCPHRAIEDWERRLVHEMLTVEYKANNTARRGHPFAVAAMAMLYQGMRVGEAMAFDIDRDVDFEANRIYIRNALSFSESHRGHIKTPKTDQGVRSMPLFAPFRACIEGKHGNIVRSIKGGALTQSVFANLWRSYKYQMTVLLNNGIQRRWADPETYQDITIRTHDFRHSFCTMICEAGVDIKTAMSWMGHSDEKMIRQIYDHMTKQRELAAEQATARMIEKKIDNLL